jgi:hydrogenase maturation protease
MKAGIIGVGNPLRRDDGIGIVLLEKLIEKKSDLPEDIEYIDGGTGGMNLLHILALFDVALIIDAVNFNGLPGESKLFKSEDICSKKSSINMSTHETDILKIITLSKELGEAPNNLFIFGVQPKDTSHGDDLSPELQKTVASLTLSLQNEIANIFDGKIVNLL